MDNFYVKYVPEFYSQNNFDLDVEPIAQPILQKPVLIQSVEEPKKANWYDAYQISEPVNKLSKLAELAKSKKLTGSKGYCARAVTDTLEEMVGHKLTRRNAWDYDKTLAEVGAKEVDTPQEGDIVWTKNTPQHSHISILVKNDKGELVEKSDTELAFKPDSTVYGGKGDRRFFRLGKKGLKFDWAPYESSEEIVYKEKDEPDFKTPFYEAYPTLYSAKPLVDAVVEKTKDPWYMQYKQILNTPVATTAKFSGDASEFIKVMYPKYLQALQANGISNAAQHAINLTAKAALESAWGKQQSGKNNLGGIKGKGTLAKTKEQDKNGVERTEYAQFRDFNSLDDYINYDINLLKSKGALEDANNFGNQLATWYATDVNYAQKINDVINSVKRRI